MSVRSRGKSSRNRPQPPAGPESGRAGAGAVDGDPRGETATETVADLLHSAAIHLLRKVRREDVHTGLGPAQASALSVLVFAGAKTLTELARMEQVRPATMSRVVSELVAAKLVYRVPSKSDARSAALEPTAKGRRLLHAGRRRRVEALAALLGGLSKAELELLTEASRLIEAVLRTAH